MRRLLSMKFFLLVITFFIFSTDIIAQTSDSQWWNDAQLIVPLKIGRDKNNKKFDKIVLNLDGIVRLGRDVSFPVDSRFAAGVDFRVNKFLKISPGYLYQRFEQIPRQRSYETRLSLAANLEKKFDLLTLRHRSMFEYKFRNSRPDTETYRARFQAAYSLKRREKEIFAPFVSEERFYDFQQRKWNRNEFYAGITRKLTPKVSLDVFYIRLDSTTVDANALGTTLKIRIR